MVALYTTAFSLHICEGVPKKKLRFSEAYLIGLPVSITDIGTSNSNYII